jgi:hypothetical protein
MAKNRRSVHPPRARALKFPHSSAARMTSRSAHTHLDMGNFDLDIPIAPLLLLLVMRVAGDVAGG